MGHARRMPSTSAGARAGTQRPGSQSALRHRNRQRIVDTLLGSGPSTQAELSRLTGLSAATVSNLVRIMAAEGAVLTSPTTSSGRRALSVRLADDGAIAVGMDFGRRHLRIVLATPGYTVLAERFVELAPGHEASDGIDLAVDLLQAMLDEQALAPSSVLGVGVGVPGPIDRRTGRVVQGTILPEWVGIDLRALEARIHHPVLFDNDANLGALAEIAWGPHTSAEDLVFVKVGTGIGAGLVLGGRTFYGARGVTGEIGHGSMIEQGVVCHCGNRGCLETVASTSMMIDLLSRAGQDRVTTADVVRNARQGDSATLRVLEDAGVALGRALANLANLINPEVLVIGGPLAGLGEILLQPVSRGLRRHAVPVIGDTTAVVMSSLGDRAEALGAAALVLQERSALAR